MSQTLPNAIVVKMTADDIHKNLISIVDGMELIRRESVNNMGATDEAKQEYLRRTGELASSIHATLDDNPILKKHKDVISGFLRKDSLLMRYDPLQEDFWSMREEFFRRFIVDASITLLKDDFRSESQAYHVFQALKYLGVNSNIDEVYDTILPVNSLLNDNSLSSPQISSFLVKKMFKGKNDGLGVRPAVDSVALADALKLAGAMYVDLPKSDYSALKKRYPKTTVVKADGAEYSRVIFGLDDSVGFDNVFETLKKYAAVDAGDSEESLVKKKSNFHGFGEEFLDKMSGLMVISKPNPKKPGKKDLDNIIIDGKPAVGGDYKTQDQWLEYWSKVTDGRVMMSAGDFYHASRQLKQAFESNDKENKKNADKIITSLRKDFDDKWLVLSTRLQYNINENAPLEGRIIQHYKSDKPELVKETSLEIPVYRGTDKDTLDLVLGQEKGLYYVQTYFDTADDAETIMQTVEFMSNKNRKSIKVWTADLDGRKSNPERAAFLAYDDDDFLISGYYDLYYFGRSRGVSYSPAGAAPPKKSNL